MENGKKTDKVVIPTGRAKKILKKIIQSEPKTVIFFRGGPGIGKSAICAQVAQEMKIGFKETFLLTRNPVDFGVPFPDEERRYAKLLPLRDILPREEVDGKIGLWFLDEMTSAPQMVQTVAQRIIWDRKIENEIIPAGWIIVAAGNRITDKGVVYMMPSPLASRFTVVDIEPELDDWVDNFALPYGINHEIIAALRMYPEILYAFDASKYDGGAFPSPRGYEKVDRKLKALGYEDEDFYSLIVGDVGMEASNKLMSFFRVYSKLPSAEKIINGDIKYDDMKDRNVLFAAVGKVVQYVLDKKDDKKVVRAFLENPVMGFPAVFAVMLIKDALTAGMKQEFVKHLDLIAKVEKKYGILVK